MCPNNYSTGYMSETTNLLELIKKSTNILVLLSSLKTIEDVDDLQLLVSLLKSQDKTYQIVSLSKAEKNLKNRLEKDEIEILNDIKPAQYTVTIDYGSSNVEKIVYDTDKKNSKLVFKILPSKGSFDFNNVQFSQEGSNFDGIICIGIENPKNLGDIYDKYENLFRENLFFLINKFSEILSILSKVSVGLSVEMVNTFLKSAINKINFIEGYPDTDEVKEILKLIDSGGDLSNAIHSKYYSKNNKILDIYKKVFENLYEDTKQKIIYSFIDLSSNSGFTKEDIVNFGRIPFNITSEFEIAFLFIQLSEKEIYSIVESNNIQKYSASTIAGIYEGYGDQGHAEFVLKFDRKDLDKRFSDVIKDLYGIEINFINTEVVVDNSGKKLTKGRKYSKNKGLKK